MKYLLFGSLKLFSLLPLRILYIFSDLIRFFLFDLFKYRKKVIIENLQYAFPQKTQIEILQIAKQFEINFCDNIVESIALLSPRLSLLKRIKITNPQKIVYEKNTCFILSHCFNWEWINFCTNYTKALDLGKKYIFYLPLKNEPANYTMNKIRTQNNSNVTLLSAYRFKHFFRELKTNRHGLCILADHRPFNPDNSLWFNFLNRPAPFILDVEKYCIQFNALPIFVNVKKIKRGYYEFYVTPMDEKLLEKKGALTQAYIEALEKQIQHYPSNYFWTHKRWKYQYNKDTHHFYH